MSIESVMPSSHLILCHPLLLWPSVFPSIMVFFSESALPIRWPKYWSFSISPSNEYSALTSLELTLNLVWQGETPWAHHTLLSLSRSLTGWVFLRRYYVTHAGITGIQKNSGPRPFWNQGPVSWETVFSQTGVVGMVSRWFKCINIYCVLYFCYYYTAIYDEKLYNSS